MVYGVFFLTLIPGVLLQLYSTPANFGIIWAISVMGAFILHQLTKNKDK